MQAASVSSAAEFLERAGPLLHADEARHNLILGLAWTLHRRPEVYPAFRLWVVEGDGEPAAAALMTPPHNLVLADAADPAALPLLAAAVRDAGVAVPGVLGNRPTVDDFTEVWAPLAGVTPILRMAEGVFALERVKPVAPAPGRPRPALPGERSLILDWLAAFFAEAMPWEPSPPEMAERMVDYRLKSETGDDGLWLWEAAGEVVSLVGFGGRTPGGQRIGPVYTPPGWRRRGYGTALVAAVSAWLLGHGRRRCFLYTDLANPTSNAMYRRIGYEQVAEAAQFGFEAGA